MVTIELNSFLCWFNDQLFDRATPLGTWFSTLDSAAAAAGSTSMTSVEHPVGNLMSFTSQTFGFMGENPDVYFFFAVSSEFTIGLNET